MADVTIESAAQANSYLWASQSGIVWTTHLIGYVFYSDGTNFVYQKTSDGGASWGGKVTVVSVANKVATGHSIWFDKWTSGDSGTIIHTAVWMWGANSSNVGRLYYNTLDTNGDTVGTAVNTNSVSTVFGCSALPTTLRSTSLSVNQNVCSITKARGGNLYIAYRFRVFDGATTATDLQFMRSTDSGSTWGNRTTMWEAAHDDTAILLPGNTSDSQDIATIFWDGSANAVSIKMYDDSANTQTETAITSGTDQANYYGYSASVRHSDGMIFVAWNNAAPASTADINFRQLDPSVISSVTVTSRTDVISNTNNVNQVDVFINQNNDDIYCAYLKGTSWHGTMGVVYKISTDSGATWGGENNLDDNANGDRSAIWAGHSIKNSGKYAPVWFDDANDDLLTTTANAVSFIDQTVTPGVLSLSTTAFAPSANIGADKLVTPDVIALVTSLKTITVLTPRLSTPGKLSLSLAEFAPQLKLVVTPGVKALSLTTFAGQTTAAQSYTIPVINLTTTKYAPTATVATTVTPEKTSLILSEYAPVLNLSVIPGLLELLTDLKTPTVTVGKTATPDVLNMVTQGYSPTILLPQIATPGVLALVTDGKAPVLNLGIIPDVLALSLTGYAPAAVVGWNLVPGTLALVLTEYGPVVMIFREHGGLGFMNDIMPQTRYIKGRTISIWPANSPVQPRTRSPIPGRRTVRP